MDGWKIRRAVDLQEDSPPVERLRALATLSSRQAHDFVIVVLDGGKPLGKRPCPVIFRLDDIVSVGVDITPEPVLFDGGKPLRKIAGVCVGVADTFEFFTVCGFAAARKSKEREYQDCREKNRNCFLHKILLFVECWFWYYRLPFFSQTIVKCWS